MPRITRVKKAQPRYATKPVLDGAGLPIRIVLTKNGQPKLTKHGRPVTIAKTVRDLERPLPPETCDHCRTPILPGTPYKHMTPRSGPYGGRRLTRHEACPTWQPWEYSSSTSASVARVQHDGAEMIEGAELETVDDFDSLRDDLAQAAAELRDEKQENLDNLPESFQYSGELYEQVEALESWVDEIESTEAPEFPEADTTCQQCEGSGEEDCGDCDGTGQHQDYADDAECPECTGTGTVKCEECGGTGGTDEDESASDADLETWREEARQVLQDALDGCQL